MSEYKRIGDLVDLIDERNKDEKVKTLIGVSIDKCFIKSVANTIGTDLSKYQVIRKFDFACSLMQVSRDGKIPIACLKDYDEAIMSPAYYIFRIKNTEEILPDYMAMWFMRPEFDREASYIAVGGVRGSMPWEDFCDMKLPVPDIKEQQKIVDTYNAITNRIQIKQKINENLEKTAQCLYSDVVLRKENIEYISIGSFGKVITGKTPSTEVSEYYGNEIPFIKTPDMHSGVFVTKVGSKLSRIGADSQKQKYIKEKSVVVACIGVGIGEVAITSELSQTNQQINAVETDYPFMLYFGIKNSYEKLHAAGCGGSTMPNLNRTDFEDFMIPTLKHDKEILEIKLSKLCNTIEINQKEMDQLEEMKHFVVSQISKR